MTRLKLALLGFSLCVAALAAIAVYSFVWGLNEPAVWFASKQEAQEVLAALKDCDCGRLALRELHKAGGNHWVLYSSGENKRKVQICIALGGHRPIDDLPTR